MESYEYILGLLESILGKGKKDRHTLDYAFMCPICNHKKPKLIVNIESGKYNCWTCHPPTKGATPISLLVKLGVETSKITEMKSYYKNDNTVIDVNRDIAVSLPDDYISFTKADGSLEYKHAANYIKNRGINRYDILKYNIGYCKKGRYRNKVIIPSYSASGKLNYFIARAFDKSSYLKYDAPSVTKTEIIGLENLINWSVPIILCEGAFDAIAIKRNAIPLFGKTIPKALMMKLVESCVKTVYLALDNDAIKEAISYCEILINHGKEVYLVELDGKDPSDIGFEKMTQLLHTAQPLTFTNLLARRLQIS
jgi:DNA primase